MSVKVDRGKYRSLEDFATDLRLVASNAKAFNPPGSIYYTEAERIEAWGLDHISKAASTVIQYETDWNIEIEKDDEAMPINIDDEEDYSIGTPMEVDEGRRSPSVSSQVQPGMSRRGARGPYKKTAQAQVTSNKLTESVDAEGRLPGSRDGLGAFLPGSDWANMMLALKLKGKRYKTKKERLRFEKEGPPLHADGSLDYTEMEDPFSVLSALAPEPETRPYLTPLHPPLFTAPSPHEAPSRPSSQPPRGPPPYTTSINLPFDRASLNPSDAPRRHWVILRNPTRSRQKDRDEDVEAPEAPVWQTPREMQVTDCGSYAALAGALEEEMRQWRVGGREGEEEEEIIQTLRETLDCEASPKNVPPPTKDVSGFLMSNYWSTQRAATAEEYIRDVVYGGVDGLAYVRSLAEFVSTPECTAHSPVLGMSVIAQVEQEIIDPLTDGRHFLLRETAIELARQTSPSSSPSGLLHHPPLSEQVKNSLQVYPSAASALVVLMQIESHKIDMGSLIKSPEELFQSEEEWAGKLFRERRKAGKSATTKVEETEDIIGAETEEPEKTWMDVDASSKNLNGEDVDHELEGPEELREVMDYVTGVIIDLDRKIKEGVTTTTPEIKDENAGNTGAEDAVVRNLRLNLLALAKRAPLDTIARLPKDLVPAHIRHFVPTLSGSA
ncbi:hypothetical protein C0991_006482 [Blastosporella zonata]|nr:hypothetical protein C0991_006482 [Blastosporella zonata]